MPRPRAVQMFSIFVVVGLLYGAWTMTPAFRIRPNALSSFEVGPLSEPAFPDFSQYRELRKLEPAEFPLDDPTRKVIVVGDLHGMIESLQVLLKKVRYSPSRDVLVHTGDVITKVPLQGSLDILNFLSTHNITGVRGNHDQTVIEWRSWLNWVTSLPGGKRWLQRLEQKWKEAQETKVDLELELWIEKERCKSAGDERRWWKHIPKGWVPLDDHYFVAKGMSDKDFQYLLSLPLRLYVPHAHTFVVHAGLLPFDPRYPLNDKERQPLARQPIPYDSENVEELREQQELRILTQVPQNLDPWTTLNMRSVWNGKPERNPVRGTYWTKLWKQQMQSCAGFVEASSDSEDEGGNVSVVHESPEFVMQTRGKKSKKRYNLPCSPFSTIYGHTASMGLDVKRWTFGLDSGCVYGRKLSALLIGGPQTIDLEGGEDDWEDEDDDDEEEFAKKRRASVVSFSDNSKAQVVSVKCHVRW